MDNETQGPWCICTCEFGKPDGYYAAAQSITIRGGKGTRERANLIVAAPDMLFALESLLEGTCEALSFLDRETVKHLKPLIDTAEAAITKAKGETNAG